MQHCLKSGVSRPSQPFGSRQNNPHRLDNSGVPIAGPAPGLVLATARGWDPPCGGPAPGYTQAFFYLGRKLSKKSPTCFLNGFMRFFGDRFFSRFFKALISKGHAGIKRGPKSKPSKTHFFLGNKKIVVFWCWLVISRDFAYFSCLVFGGGFKGILVNVFSSFVMVHMAP